MKKLGKELFDDVFELIPERVSGLQLEEGDHIFVRRATGYSHHGIYVGQKDGIQYVIHFNKKIPPCSICKHKASHRAQLILTCLVCFLYDGTLNFYSLYRYQYRERRVALPDTCTPPTAKPPKEVVKIAYELLEKGFGKYDLVLNNCEHFATFCKTGVAISSQVDYVVKLTQGPPGSMLLPPMRINF